MKPFLIIGVAVCLLFCGCSTALQRQTEELYLTQERDNYYFQIASDVEVLSRLDKGDVAYAVKYLHDQVSENLILLDHAESPGQAKDKNLRYFLMAWKYQTNFCSKHGFSPYSFEAGIVLSNRAAEFIKRYEALKNKISQ